MRARDLNWMQVEEYLSRDDRVVLPIGSTEQHGYLSLETDNILAERVSAEAAEPLGVLVLPALPYGLTPNFAAYPGSPTLRLETFVAVLRDLLDSLHAQGFRRFLVVNGHGGNLPGNALVREWVAFHPDAKALFFGASYHADYATILCAPSDLPAAATALADYCASDGDPGHPAPWDAVDLRRLRCGDRARYGQVPIMRARAGLTLR